MQVFYYRKFKIYYEDCRLISIVSVKYGIEHIRLYPTRPVPNIMLFLLVDKLIYDSEEAYSYYYFEKLEPKDREDLNKAYGNHLLTVYGGNSTFLRY